ncbi:MAG TPA: hypothetical protein EYP85_08955 [Armatimonadetes bacterium]|nr:hypothetical protein [Armatimonadota bacterium]
MNELARWQKVLFWLWLLLAVTGMVTQYAVTRYNGHWVVVAPLGTATTADFLESGLAGKGPVVFITRGVLDEVAHKLHQFPFVAPADVLVAVLFAIAVLLTLKNRQRVDWVAWPPLCLWAFLLAAGLSVLGAESMRNWLTETAQLALYFFAGYWLAVNLLRRETEVRRTVVWLLGVSLLVLAFGLRDYWVHIYAAPLERENPLWVRATFMSRTAFCGLLALVLPLFLGFLLKAPTLGRKVAWAVPVGLALYPLLSLGALVAVGAALLLMAAREGWRTLLFTALAVVVVAVLWVPFMSARQLDYLVDSVDFYDQAGEVTKRYLEWAATYNLLADGHALFGVGAGENYQHTIGQYYYFLPNPEKMEPDTYNLYLIITAQMGFLGLWAWLYVLFDFLRRARRLEAAREPYYRGLSLGLWGSLVSVAVFSLFGTILVRGTGLVLTLLLALIARVERLAGKEEIAPPPAEEPLPPEEEGPPLPELETERLDIETI